MDSAPTETLMIAIFGLMLVVFVGAVAVAAIAKRRSQSDSSDGQKEILKAMTQNNHPLPASAPEPPSDPLERHAHYIGIENRARDDALFIASNAEEGSRVWVLAGPGPVGAVALGAARHLDSLGHIATSQLMHYPDKLGEEAGREFKTLTAARLPAIESPTPRSFDGAKRLVVGADRSLLPEPRLKDLDSILEAAEAEGLDVVELGAFDAGFHPGVPSIEDAVIPVPDRPLSREDVRLLDSLAQEHYGILGAALMENAGFWGARECYLVASDLAEQKGAESPAITVLCGRGNNGGDGFVMARHLHHWGVTPRVFLLGTKERVTDDNGSNMRLLESQGVKVTPIFDDSQWPMVEESLAGSHLVIDAVLGTGMTGTVRGAAVDAIQRMNAAREKGCWILAVDGPSGIDCNTGEPLGHCVTADVTVTFAASKSGFQLGQGPALCGKVVLADIGLPREIYRRQQGA